MLAACEEKRVPKAPPSKQTLRAEASSPSNSFWKWVVRPGTDWVAPLHPTLALECYRAALARAGSA